MVKVVKGTWPVEPTRRIRYRLWCQKQSSGIFPLRDPSAFTTENPLQSILYAIRRMKYFNFLSVARRRVDGGGSRTPP